MKIARGHREDRNEYEYFTEYGLDGYNCPYIMDEGIPVLICDHSFVDDHFLLRELERVTRIHKMIIRQLPKKERESRMKELMDVERR